MSLLPLSDDDDDDAVLLSLFLLSLTDHLR